MAKIPARVYNRHIQTNSKNMTSKKTALSLVLIIILAGVVWYFWKLSNKKTAPSKSSETAATLGENIADKVANPGTKLPDVNPYDAKTNPFEEAKTNPFRDVYKNPFK